LQDYSLVNYDIKYRGSINGESYTQIYNGNGGLQRITFGFSYIVLNISASVFNSIMHSATSQRTPIFYSITRRSQTQKT